MYTCTVVSCPFNLLPSRENYLYKIFVLISIEFHAFIFNHKIQNYQWWVNIIGIQYI